MEYRLNTLREKIEVLHRVMKMYMGLRLMPLTDR